LSLPPNPPFTAPDTVSPACSRQRFPLETPPRQRGCSCLMVRFSGSNGLTARSAALRLILGFSLGYARLTLTRLEHHGSIAQLQIATSHSPYAFPAPAHDCSWPSSSTDLLWRGRSLSKRTFLKSLEGDIIIKFQHKNRLRSGCVGSSGDLFSEGGDRLVVIGVHLEYRV
jgi:hypothetical protein